MEKKDLKQLLLRAATVKPGAVLEFQDVKFSAEEIHSAVKEELQKLGGTYNQFQRNKLTIFELIQETVDEVLPKRVFDSLDQFVDVYNLKNGQKKYFTKREGYQRGRNFVTRVSHAGVYEVFKLDRSSFEISTEAHGAAVQISVEEVLEGRIDFGELMDLITDGFEISMYKEIARQMLSLKSNTILPKNNLMTANGWDPRGFHSLLGIARAYAEPTIFCSYMFAADMIPHMHAITDRQKEEIQSKGYIGTYMGAKVVILPTSFYETSNEGGENLTFPPGLAFIIPTGMVKPIKVVFEGDMVIREFENRDFSSEIQMYKKYGAALFANPGICIYENTSLNTWPAVKGPIFVPAEGEVTADATYKYTRLV